MCVHVCGVWGKQCGAVLLGSAQLEMCVFEVMFGRQCKHYAALECKTCFKSSLDLSTCSHVCTHLLCVFQTTSVPAAGLSSGFGGYAGPAPSAALSASSPSLHASSLSVTHAQRASSMSSAHTGLPSSPISTPPRPSILNRKRSHDK